MPLNVTNDDQFFQLGVAHQNAGRLAEAERAYLEALKWNPNNAFAFHNLALIALSVGRTDIALAHLNRSIQINPTSADNYNSLGEVYRAMLRGQDAITAFNKAIELNPRHFRAYNNRGIIHALLGQITEAIASWQTAIQLTDKTPAANPTRAMIYNNLGNVHLELAQIDLAVDAHKHAVELDPNFLHAHSNLLRDYNHLTTLTPEQLASLHQTYTAKCIQNITPLSLNNNPDPNRRLRIGFLSPDFREHAVAYFLMGLFENYDRSAFDFISYANINNADNFTRALEQKTTLARNIISLSDEQAARLIQQDNIDILIDLAGHTAGNRFRVFAFKPAPIQATYLGYPVTTGLATIDYRITDHLADPPGLTESHFTEKLYRLDRSAWCYRPPVEVPADDLPPVLRNKSPFTFGSFNSYAKITPDMIQLWARILTQLPDSKFFLKSNILTDESGRRHVLAQFAAANIPADRLILKGRQTSTADHLLQYQSVDLALDTFPYHGTTTTCEALYMNVPVITLEGKTHMSRVGVSLLSAVEGMNELIAPNPDAYIAIAVRLATNPAALAALRKNLRERFLQSPLTNAPNFAQHFCTALRTMWQQRTPIS